MTQTRILVIDDDPDLCELICDALCEQYDIQTCSEAEACVALCRDYKPAIVLLDVNLRNANGLALCKEICEQGKTSPLVLFISGENTLERRIDTYEHGGADFLAKPFQLKELKAKIETLAQFHNRENELSQSNELATKTALNAMAEASQYGGVLRFFNEMYKADNTQKITASFFNLMDDFGLNTSIQFRIGDTETFDSNDKSCSPIELQIYDNLRDNGRMIAFSSRMMINGAYASFIVRNMPTDDEINNGRLRDILATLIEGIDSKLTDLQRLHLLRQTSTELSESSERLADVVRSHESFITGAMNHVIAEISGSFDTLELTEDQEKFFTRLTENILNSLETSLVPIGNEQDVLNCLRLSLTVVLGTTEND